MRRLHLDRRSFLARVLGGAVIAGGAIEFVLGKRVMAAELDLRNWRKGPKVTDNDLTDMPGAGKGVATGRTDSDSSDVVRRGRTAVTDLDSVDSPDHGFMRRSGQRRIVNDADNQDIASSSRIYYQTGRTDEDPTDGVNEGRTGITDIDGSDRAERGNGPAGGGGRR